MSEAARGGAVAPPAPGGELSYRQVMIVLFGLLLGMLLSGLDQTIVATASRTIGDSLGGLDQQAWLTTAFLVTSTITTLIYGKLSDVFGRKPLYLTAIGIFLVGSALCGLATSMPMLAVFRGLQGLGAGGLMSLAFAITAAPLSPPRRAHPDQVETLRRELADGLADTSFLGRLDPALAAPYLAGFTKAMDLVSVVGAGVALLGRLLALSIEEAPLRGPSGRAAARPSDARDLAQNFGLCRSFGDSRKPGLKSVSRVRSKGRQAVAIRCYRAPNSLSSGRLGSFRATFTKNATEPNFATPARSEDRQNAPGLAAQLGRLAPSLASG